LRAAVDRLIRRVGHWEQQRWAKPAASPDRTRRADMMFALIQELADAGAAAERRPPRVVPRLDNDLALPDQLRVMAADLISAQPGDEVLDGATRLVTQVASLL
jgi:hypothetical protein